MGVDRVMPLAVLAPFELVGRGNLMPGRELELLFFEEQVKELDEQDAARSQRW